MQSDISDYYPDGIVTSKERFFDLQNDPAMRTLLVIDADKNNPYRGAICCCRSRLVFKLVSVIIHRHSHSSTNRQSR
ncbi:hypothetical protein ACT691_08900 [Vibrio metschnikovii]